jgi:hypothetical protein
MNQSVLFPLLLLFFVILNSHCDTIEVPNDYKSIGQALEQAREGDRVIVSPGKYFERIKIPKGVTLRSAGNDEKGKIGLRRAELVILDGKGESSKDAGIELGEGSVVDGLTVTGMGKYDDDAWNKHFQTNGMNQSYDRIGGYNAPAIGADSVNAAILNCIVHHNGNTGIAVAAREAPAVVKVQGNTCFRNMGGGIGYMAGTRGGVTENHCYENFYAGIGMEAGHPLISSNHCHNNIRAGIGISEGACPIVRKNHCHNNRRAGIGVRTGENTRPVIIANDCHDNSMTGIGLSDGAYAIIKGNHCYKNALTGIGLQTGASALIIGNECNENKAAGIGQREVGETLLMDNHIHHNGASGLGFDTTSINSTSKCVGNRIHDNNLVGVGIHKGWNVQLVGNEISRSGGMPPLVMIFEGSHAEFTDNKLTGGGVASIRCAGSVLIEGNVIKPDAGSKGGRGPSSAIWALPGAEVVAHGNEFQGWRKALLASGAKVIVSQNRGYVLNANPFQLDKSVTGSRIANNDIGTSSNK